MTWTKFLTQSCTIRRATKSISSLSGEETESFADHLTGVRCMLQSRRGRYVVDDAGGHTVDQWTLYLDPGTDILNGDRVVVDGVTYKVYLNHELRYLTPHHMEVIVDRAFVEVNP